MRCLGLVCRRMRATVPYWLDRPYEPRPPLEGDVRVDVCVVGAGMGGVAAAWHLTERGASVAVVEAGVVAGGASGRNGGFLIAGAAPMYHATRRLWGRERARRVHAATLAGQAQVLEMARACGAGDVFRRTGLLRLAVDGAEAADVLAHHAALVEDGFPAELVAEDDLPVAVCRPGRRALLTPHDGSVNPVALLRRVAAELERRGARIFEGTRVTGPPAGGAVATDRGRIGADAVVVAADGHLAALVPAAAAVRCRRLNVCASAPGEPERLPLPVYVRYGHEYAQQRPDGAVVLGGFSDLDGGASWTSEPVVSEPVQRRLEAYLRDELSVGAPVTHRWVGLVGYAQDPLPRCGPVPGAAGVYALGGYNGTGNVQAFVAARVVAELITRGESADGDLYAPVDAS